MKIRWVAARSAALGLALVGILTHQYRMFERRWQLLVTFCLLVVTVRGFSATFPGNAVLIVSDPAGSLSWNNSSNALTVQCWFKFSIPSGTNLTSNMAILVNSTTGTEGNPQAFLFRFNIYNGNVEFVTQGSLGGYTNTLIQQPYLERWYHLAVVRQGSAFTGYVDGLPAFTGAANVGDSSIKDGISIGGWGDGDYLYGEVQEVSVYQNALDRDFIAQYMYNSQPTNDPTLGLTGYYPVGFSANGRGSLSNLAPGGSASSASIQGSGAVTFPETDQAGEQSAFDAWRNGGRNSFVPLSGAFTWQQSIFSRPTPGISFDLHMEYSSANSSSGALLGSISPYTLGILGGGWRHSFQTTLIPSQDFAPLENTDVVGLMRWDGSIETWDFDYTAAEYLTRDGEYNGELAEGVTNWTWTTPDRLVYSFYPPDRGPNFVMYGRLISIHDFNGNSVQLHWNQTSGVLTQIVDSVGGTYNFNYHATLLTNITFNSWSVNFAYDSTNRLISKMLTNTSGLYSSVSNTWQFAYGTNGLLSQIIDPRGNTNTFVQYDQYERMTNQTDALGRSTATFYDSPTNGQITHIDPATNSWVQSFDRKGNILSQSDPLGNRTSYTYDTNNNRTSITEPLGWVTSFGYDNRANMIAKTNALGEITTWNFDPFFNKPIQQITQQPPDANGLSQWTNFYAYDSGGNLTNHSDGLGSLVTYTYSTNGLVLTATDANDNTTRFAYDTNGFMNACTDPATNTTSYILTDVGWKLRETDALGDPTDYAYDLNGKVVRILDALGRIFDKTYDATGNLLSSTDGKMVPTTYGYDAANQRTNMTDRTVTNKWSYFYTSLGKLDHVTDPLTNSITNTFDAANRLVRVTDPLGQSVTNQYDANGNLTAYFDKTGQRWTKVYDRLNRVISETDPLGNSRTTSFDVADRIQQVTSPNGYPSTHIYDGRGRLIKWVDQQGSPWLYSYDGVGNITNITDALGGHYVMAYGPRNERAMERNQDGKTWSYAYDELLRLKTRADPNGIIRMPTYDAAGRVLIVNFSTGRRDSFNYDANDNPQSVSRRYSGVTTATDFIYDQLDRVVEQDDALGKTVLYGYDPLGRVTAITYPGSKTLANNYDALGRLTSQVDWAGRQMAYTYDKADRLTSRTYPNGVAQTNTFDTAGRITGLNYYPPSVNSNSINVALSYAYDRNGNKTGSSESGTFNWPVPSLTDDQSSFTPGGRLINRQTTESSPTNSVNTISYHYDASGNMTNATGNSQSWTLAYDEDNRTASIQWSAGATNAFVTNRYDALGRRISKSADGVTFGYVLSLVGGMERVLCDLDGSGNITAWYVHGPDLCYRVDPTNGVICFHADAAGNIIALTDANMNLAAQYAYTPYGRSLGSTNFQPQISNPYLFVGSQGVMQESEIPNLYFMRARYYTADAGIFLSTDPVKKIGPGWSPVAYQYANENPNSLNDPNGQIALIDTFAIAAVTEILDEGADDLMLDLAPDAGSRKTAQQLINVKNAIGDGKDVVDGINALNAGSEGAASYAVSQAGKYTGQAAYASAPIIMSAYINGIYAIGNAVGNVLYDDFGFFNNSSTTYLSSMAGTTPMAILNQSQAAVNQTMASRAATIAAPVASGATAATATKPAGAAVGGTTSSSIGGSTTYVVKPGDTLGNIGYANGTTATAIGAANGIQNLNLIYPGQVLTIPHP